MALAIFDVTPTRVQVGTLFDTEKRYIYKSNVAPADASFVKVATSATVIGYQDKLTYSFDGAVYFVNAQLPLTPTFAVFGIT